jgi:prolipoprotein diacylglyceryl transferase
MALTSGQLFHRVGIIALAAASSVSAYAALRLGLNPLWLIFYVPLATASLVGLTYIRQLVTGREQLVLIENATAAAIAVLAVVSLLGQPIAAWSDVTAIGIGTFAGIGRIGCLLTGCCYGCPARIGIVYRHETGPGRPVDVRLFPVQVLESAALLSIAISAVVVSGRSPGSATAVTLMAYGMIRSGTEILRGDRAGRAVAQLVPRLEAIVLIVTGGLVALVTQPNAMTWVAASIGAAALTAVLALTRPRLGRYAETVHVDAIRGLIEAALDQQPASLRSHRVGPFLVLVGPFALCGLHVSISVRPGQVGNATRALSSIAIGAPFRHPGRRVAHAIYLRELSRSI